MFYLETFLMFKIVLFLFVVVLQSPVVFCLEEDIPSLETFISKARETALASFERILKEEDLSRSHSDEYGTVLYSKVYCNENSGRVVEFSECLAREAFKRSIPIENIGVYGAIEQISLVPMSDWTEYSKIIFEIRDALMAIYSIQNDRSKTFLFLRKCDFPGMQSTVGTFMRALPKNKKARKNFVDFTIKGIRRNNVQAGEFHKFKDLVIEFLYRKNNVRK